MAPLSPVGCLIKTKNITLRYIVVRNIIASLRFFATEFTSVYWQPIGMSGEEGAHLARGEGNHGCDRFAT